MHKLYDKTESTTQRRKLTHSRLHGVLTAHSSDTLTPDMNLGHSLRALGTGQRAVLDSLFEVFEEHPDTQFLPKIFEDLGKKLLTFAEEED